MIALRMRCASSMLSNSGSPPPQITGTHSLGMISSGPMAMPHEESTEVGELHAAFRSTIGHQERVEFVEVEVTRAKQRRAHAPLLHRVISFVDCRRFCHTLGLITSVLC